MTRICAFLLMLTVVACDTPAEGLETDVADWPAQLNWPNLFGRTGGWLVAAFMPPSRYKAA